MMIDVHKLSLSSIIEVFLDVILGTLVVQIFINTNNNIPCGNVVDLLP